MMMMSPENRQLYRYQGFGTIAVYDRNKDGVFDEEEMKLLLIVSMDYDEDKVLQPMEIKKSRTPPGLMFEEGWFQKDAKAFDTNGDGVIVPSEMRVPEVVSRALDKNKDGKISLEELAQGAGRDDRRLPAAVPRDVRPDRPEDRRSTARTGSAIPTSSGGSTTTRTAFISVTEFDRYARGSSSRFRCATTS